MWHKTCDNWLVVNFLSKLLLPSSIGLGEKVIEGLEEKGDGANELMNYKGVCRTALATPGLLNMVITG